jgi:hypothetical protein
MSKNGMSFSRKYGRHSMDDRIHCLWITLDSFELKSIVLENKGLILDMPFDEFIETLKGHFKEKIGEK